jgi:hypothetical protein
MDSAMTHKLRTVRPQTYNGVSRLSFNYGQQDFFALGLFTYYSVYLPVSEFIALINGLWS